MGHYDKFEEKKAAENIKHKQHTLIDKDIAQRLVNIVKVLPDDGTSAEWLHTQINIIIERAMYGW